jgi:hypothetical protein
MSEYQYYEFCKINSPLTAEARKEMCLLSSRAKITTHGAFYVYNYGDFRGNPKELLSKYFDVFFYISNWGCIRLIFKYSPEEIDVTELKKYNTKHVINCIEQDQHVLLDIDFTNKNGFGWVEGEGMLPNLLPLYDEIKFGNYRFLQLITHASQKNDNTLLVNNSILALSSAQEAFFKYAEIDQKIFFE